MKMETDLKEYGEMIRYLVKEYSIMLMEISMKVI